MPKDLIKDTTETIVKRCHNPIVATFMLSWIVVNWKAIAFFILSDINIEMRIARLSMLYFDVWHIAILPMSITLIWLFGAPWLLLQYRKESEGLRANLIEDTLKEDTRNTKLAGELAIAKRDLKLAESGVTEIEELKTKNSELEEDNTSLLTDLTKFTKECRELKLSNDDLAEDIVENSKFVFIEYKELFDAYQQLRQDNQKIKINLAQANPKIRLGNELKGGESKTLKEQSATKDEVIRDAANKFQIQNSLIANAAHVFEKQSFIKDAAIRNAANKFQIQNSLIANAANVFEKQSFIKDKAIRNAANKFQVQNSLISKATDVFKK